MENGSDRGGSWAGRLGRIGTGRGGSGRVEADLCGLRRIETDRGRSGRIEADLGD
uniref:AraC family transcriptional regulator n=1 Tax=Setaria digitata TaxID=48799 RepID=A0A915Q622_9BILA